MQSQVQVDHPLLITANFPTVEDYVLHLMHLKAYEYASTLFRGRTVLDWGCNSGYGMSVLASTARQVGGVDTSEMCLAEVRSRYPEFANFLWLFDGNTIPVPKRDWDAVVSFQVIEHVPDVDAYLQTIRAVLGTGSLALFATPNRLIRLAPGMRPWNRFHVQEFSAAELRATLLEHFRYVQILGLQGDADIVNTERERSARAKRYALLNQTASGRMTMRLQNIISRTTQGLLPGKQHSPFQESLLEQWTTEQLFYDADRLDDAIDLLAICSDEWLESAPVA